MHCYTLQPTATHCNTLQHTTGRARRLAREGKLEETFADVLHSLIRTTIDDEQQVCCSVLQCVAAWCSVLQCGAVWCSVVQCNAVWCGVLQCLQCVAVCHVIFFDLHHY